MMMLRDHIADLLFRLAEAEQTGRQRPHREKYLPLLAGFMRRYFELRLDLVDEVERELGPARGSAREPS
jgi:hypothetical protein